MQWMMLQQDKPQDYVIATGVQYSVREFISIPIGGPLSRLIWGNVSAGAPRHNNPALFRFLYGFDYTLIINSVEKGIGSVAPNASMDKWLTYIGLHSDPLHTATSQDVKVVMFWLVLAARVSYVDILKGAHPSKKMFDKELYERHNHREVILLDHIFHGAVTPADLSLATKRALFRT
jgi:hypothetical protein